MNRRGEAPYQVFQPVLNTIDHGRVMPPSRSLGGGALQCERREETPLAILHGGLVAPEHHSVLIYVCMEMLPCIQGNNPFFPVQSFLLCKVAEFLAQEVLVSALLKIH